MIETTYVRIEKAAEMLDTDTDTLLLAALERRFRLFGLINRHLPLLTMTRPTLCKKTNRLQADWVDAGTKPVLFAYAKDECAARLLAGEPAKLCDFFMLTNMKEDLGVFHCIDPLAVLDDDDSLDLRRIFASRQQVESIRKRDSLPEKELEPVLPNPPDRTYQSPQLATLNQAAFRFWSKADQHDPTTHPGNSDVSAWLIDRGFSQSQASKAASIIRPQWAHVGRKPDA
ncbi:MAG TPA: hypothetical protein PL143_00850 [Rhodocyclaceae bacterium]|nr:hypothetical protein [Rhodocyclaceae bacterium]